ncbi:UPF0481 protein At3g47200-like [Alnus glutinosa]|uniref:UPF0481 protein At3g47200-like n=1 Tax=Alnus glutinosa TaxID=3517 RepID=UPI002D774083|nr:UPF0481 protein At3g47200-like [Alnus glutinosa]
MINIFLRDRTLTDISSELPNVDWPECCIYRVPKLLRKVNEEAYTPKLISIGPFHHDRRELRDMEMHKLRYFKKFLDRTGKSEEDLRKIIEDDEKKIRLCYSEDCRLNNRHFVKMVLLDAIFIIELFLKVKKRREDEEKEEEEDEEKEEEEDYILRKKWLANGIYYDLLLLENQLPFFVLEKLYKFAGFSDSSSSCNHHEEGKPVEEHKKDLGKEDAPIVKLFRNYLTYYDEKRRKSIGEEVIEESTGKGKTETPICEEVKHFTDVLRYLFCPPYMEGMWIRSTKMKRQRRKLGCQVSMQAKKKKKKKRNSGTQICVTKLNDAGLKFKVDDDTCLLNITLLGCLERCDPCFNFFDRYCLPCLSCLMCFLFTCFPFTCFLGCFGYPMHVLGVPQLVIDHGTEAIFRNLMALEQCHYPSKTYICSYVLLLDGFIDTKKDVDLLVDKKVIVNHLGSNAEVATLINKLGDQIVATTPSYFDDIAQQLNEHYEFPLNHLLATLKREYFPNIFRGTATIVGLIVLGFTLWNFLRPYVM